MAVRAVPERIRWAVETLAVTACDRLLEIGCGGGAAVGLVCRSLSTGVVTAIDRSATMAARAEQRNAAHIRAGRAIIRTATFRAADLFAAGLDTARYDKIFAINVNLFWTGPADHELALAARLLAPGGGLYLCYDPPGNRADEIVQKVTATLTGAGFGVQVERSAGAVAVIGRPYDETPST
ncbi:SAM-dependent methyltransferase [Micromonospora deserti]|uniref:Class I SAM-dependent methyltransferase n=1 Tax=Micromonospora deserti TaxID=2070366 RepID=A0A2W2CXU3_9ACTN|nr:class I SAM-dependent methyltransferase [Micromonospora deserti]PZG02701.1 class I SAM-dependent methyltransferase [Micromonospora deserti]